MVKTILIVYAMAFYIIQGRRENIENWKKK